MGYHATVQDALVTLLEAATPEGCDVINLIAVDEVDLQRLSCFVAVIRERIEMEYHEEINPSTSYDTQLEEWEWGLYVAGGGGAYNEAGKGAEVDLILEAIRTALNAQKLTTECGPLSILSEEYEGPHGTGVVYLQRWRHSRKADS